MEATKFVNIPTWQPFHICLDCENCRLPFQDGLLAVSINMHIRISCGYRALSIILPSASYRALCHLIPCFVSIIPSIFPQPMLVGRPSPGGLRRFLNTDFTPDLLGKHPPACSTSPAVCAAMSHAGSGWNCLDISH